MVQSSGLHFHAPPLEAAPSPRSESVQLRPERLRLPAVPRASGLLAGFSDKTLETLKLLDADPGALLRVIEAVEL